MDKKTKLKELYEKLTKLQNKEVLPEDGMDGIMQNLIKDEVSNLNSTLSKKLGEYPSIKILKKFSNELTTFKKDFDLKPITESIQQLEEELKNNQDSLISQFENELTSRIEEIKSSMSELPTKGDIPKSFDSSNLERDIAALRRQFLSKQDFDSKPLQRELENLKIALKGLSERETKDVGAQARIEEINNIIKELKADLMTRISNLGGGSQNQKISINGTVMSTKYADINLTGSGITSTNNNTTKQVDIDFSGLVGGSSLADVSADSTTTPKSLYTMTSTIPVQFISSDSHNILYLDETNELIKIGSGTSTFTNAGATGGIIATQAGGNTFYVPFAGQNTSAGTTSSTDIILGNNLATDSTNYSDFGINSSNNADPLYTAMGAGAAYWYNQSEALALGTAANKPVNIFTGGTLTANIRMTILGTGNVGIGTTSPTNILSLGNASDRKIWIENSATDVIGRNLTVAAGGTVAGTSIADRDGGTLTLTSGLGTGTGDSRITFQTGATLTTGTTLQTMTTRMTLLGNGNLGIGFSTAGNILHRLEVSGSVRNTGKASFTLTGTGDPDGTTTLVGTNSLFLTELSVGDNITVNAETRRVTAIANNTSLTVDTAFTDTASGATMTALPAIFLARQQDNSIGLTVNYSGNVRIGTVIPMSTSAATVSKLDAATSAVRYAQLSYNGVAAGVFRYDDNSAATGLLLENRDITSTTNHGIDIDYNFSDDTTTTAIAAGTIRVAKENAWTTTGSTQLSFMAFFTRNGVSNSEKMRISSTGNVGIATTTPLTHFHVVETTSTTPRGIMSGQISSDTSSARMNLNKARGTAGSETTVVTGDNIGNLIFNGYDGTSYLGMANIMVVATGTIGTGRVPTYMAFSTGTDAATSVLTEAMRITAAQRIGIATTAPDKIVEINLGTADALRLTYNDNSGSAATYMDSTLSSTGVLTFTPVGTGQAIAIASRFLEAQGVDVVAANDLTLGFAGNAFEVTGATQINAITTTGWTLGSRITLIFASTPTVKHNTAGGGGTAVILLAGAADFSATAGDTLSLIYSEQGGTNAWREISRAVI